MREKAIEPPDEKSPNNQTYSPDSKLSMPLKLWRLRCLRRSPKAERRLQSRGISHCLRLVCSAGSKPACLGWTVCLACVFALGLFSSYLLSLVSPPQTVLQYHDTFYCLCWTLCAESMVQRKVTEILVHPTWFIGN